MKEVIKKSRLQEVIEKRSESILINEYEEIKTYVRQNQILNGMVRGNTKMMWTMFPEYIENITEKDHLELFKAIQKRREKIIQEQTDLIFKKLEIIDYLFKESIN